MIFYTNFSQIPLIAPHSPQSLLLAACFIFLPTSYTTHVRAHTHTQMPWRYRVATHLDLSAPCGMWWLMMCPQHELYLPIYINAL